MTYPKVNGKPFDSIRRQTFDQLRKRFRFLIAQAAEHDNVVLDSKLLTTAAWNCAFEAVTQRTS